MSDRIMHDNTKTRCNVCNNKYVKTAIETQFNGNQSFVYLICNSTSKRLKIGYSSKPDSRLKSLQTGSADNLYIYAVIPGGIKLEKRLHLMFSHYHDKGEWFEYAEDIFNYFDNYNA